MKRVQILILLTAFSTATFGQGGFENILTGSAFDAKYLADGYVTPFMKAFGYGMNNGWYTSGAPHKLGGFELTVTSANVFVPAVDEKYYVDNSKMTDIELLAGDGASNTPQNGYVPTFFGGNTPPVYHTPNSIPVPVKFQGPVGVGLKFLPVPGLTLGVGLPLGFEVKVRYVPTLDFRNISNGDVTGGFSLMGFGLMHDFKQWIPGLKELPFDMSVFAGYTKLSSNLGFDPDNPDRKAEFSSNATTIQALISKKLAVITVYGSVGYNMATTNMALKGAYDFDGDGTEGETAEGEKDPFTIGAESGGMRATVGLRLRLAVIAFHGDYTMQQYGRVITGGFGINFR